jgi:hypothetical protein
MKDDGGAAMSDQDEHQEAQDAIKAVIAVHKLHKPYSFAPGDVRCSECWTGDSPAAWPCNTIKALGE